MGLFGFSTLFFPWGIVLQAVAVIHFIRRRPDTYWLFVIIFLGPLGALIYLCVEGIPDLGLLGHSRIADFRGASAFASCRRWCR